MSLPRRVKIVEVGLRDGLQNEKMCLNTDTKIRLIDDLGDAGLTSIECGSFVNPNWIPQMADSGDVFKGIRPRQGVSYSALVPNLLGLERAQAVDVDEIAIFGAASETFSQKNINCSIAESLQRFKPIIEVARQFDIPVRGYLSCVIACPYEGEISAEKVADLAETLINMGCYEVSLGDTTGVGTPARVNRMLDAVIKRIPLTKIAVHFHDTYGQGLANIYSALLRGVTVVDSAVSGLGGCPYAKGAAGNVSTEDLVYMLNGEGIQHGVDLEKLIPIGREISTILGRDNGSKVSRALS
jgi:hydroxymethylglutaryl-CoA lyase